MTVATEWGSVPDLCQGFMGDSLSLQQTPINLSTFLLSTLCWKHYEISRLFFLPDLEPIKVIAAGLTYTDQTI
jgi:hypothetical protein